MKIVILAGGGGTRLWPKSRIKNPKQFQTLIDEKSMIKNTVKRLQSVVKKEKIYIATNRDHLSEIKKEAPEIKNFIVEPYLRNTGPSVAYASLILSKKTDEPVAFLPSDHHIGNKANFAKALQTAGEAAKDDKLVLIGIKPTEADTGLGYIKINSKLKNEKFSAEVFTVEKFAEKPNFKTAQNFVKSGQYLWNAGMFVARPKVILELAKKHAPEIYKHLEKISRNPKNLDKEYKKIENISFDYAISEKAKNIAVVAGDFNWSDIGSWSKILETLSQNIGQNVIVGCEHLGIDTKGCLIHGTNRLVVTIGLSDVIVVDTPDVVLVCHKSKAQDVKKIVERLKEEKKEHYL